MFDTGCNDVKGALNQMMVGAWITQAVSVAAELGLADLLHERPTTAEELAARLDADVDSLRRLLRALCSVGVFRLNGRGGYELDAIGALLRSDVADSQRAFARMAGAEFYRAWQGLKCSVMNGTTAAKAQEGRSFYAELTKAPARQEIFDASMNSVHGPEIQPMLDAYDFSGCATVVDVGGGNGAMLAGVLERHPQVRGVLFELPEVAARARALFESRGLAARVTVVGGDFFKAIPPAGDLYLLRHVLHNWEDADAVAILVNCRKHLRQKSRVLLVESLLPEQEGFSFVKWLDLMMLVVGGRERTVREYARLLDMAGLRLDRVIPTSCSVSLLEGVPA